MACYVDNEIPSNVAIKVIWAILRAHLVLTLTLAISRNNEGG